MSDKNKVDVDETIETFPATPALGDVSLFKTASLSATNKGRKETASNKGNNPSIPNSDEQKLLKIIGDSNALGHLANVGADALKGNSKNGTSSIGGISTKDLAAMDSLLKKYAINEKLQNLQLDARGSRSTIKETKNHKFWITQPVVPYEENVEAEGPIEPNKSNGELRQEPYALPKDFEWSLVNVDDVKEIKELYELLSLNYVEDDDNMFRFDYSADFLKWALKPPGWRPQWIIGVRVTSNRKLVAFISGIPATLRVRDHSQLMVEINFLCVHKKLRSKRLAPVMIKEVTRRVHLEGIFQAVYTAGTTLPKPITTCRYYHRSLNPKKLIETQFSHLSKNMTLKRLILLNQLPKETQIPGLRPMAPADVSQVTSILNNHLKTYEMAPVFSEEEVKHWLLPLPSVISSFVVEEPITKTITDFISFYSLPSTVIGNPIHTHVNAAYLYYYVPSSVAGTLNLIRDALILAKKANFDVLNCLDLMANEKVLNELKFGRGDGNLNYYLFNYRCKEMAPKEMGLLLL